VWSCPSTPPFFRRRVRGAVPVWIAKLREELEKVEQNSPKQALNSILNLEQALFAYMRCCCVGFSCTHQQFNTIFVNCYIRCLIFIKFFGITYPWSKHWNISKWCSFNTCEYGLWPVACGPLAPGCEVCSKWLKYSITVTNQEVEQNVIVQNTHTLIA
jgi:hypothetical protein